MAVITAPGKESWVVARRGFDLLIERAQAQLSDQPNLAKRLTVAKALDGLHLGEIPSDDCTSIIEALEIAINELLAELKAQPQDQVVTSYSALLNELRERLRDDKP